MVQRQFYETDMTPRFLDGVGYDELTLNIPCLRRDIALKNDGTLRIFINKIDIYFEVQTGYGSLKMSDKYRAKDYETLLELINLLDTIANRVSN